MATIALVLNIYRILLICYLSEPVPGMYSIFLFFVSFQCEVLMILLFDRLYTVFKKSTVYRLSRVTVVFMMTLFVTGLLTIALFAVLGAFFYHTQSVLFSLVALTLLLMGLIGQFINMWVVCVTALVSLSVL